MSVCSYVNTICDNFDGCFPPLRFSVGWETSAQCSPTYFEMFGQHAKKATLRNIRTVHILYFIVLNTARISSSSTGVPAESVLSKVILSIAAANLAHQWPNKSKNVGGYPQRSPLEERILN